MNDRPTNDRPTSDGPDENESFGLRVLPRDCELFQEQLRDFVPPDAFDAHAHLYDLRLTAGGGRLMVPPESNEITRDAYTRRVGAWMGDRLPSGGLFFPFPHRDAEIAGQNRWIAEQVRRDPNSRALMLVSPKCDPAACESLLADGIFVGFKVYHVFAPRRDTFHASCDEFMPEWMWELADQRGLAITLHMVKVAALCDPANQRYIREHCVRYPGAKLILAHSGRSFQARHTVDGIESLRGLDNVFFDNSAICEAAPNEAILRTFGPTRLWFGTDSPISEVRGRCVSIADGFLWSYDIQPKWEHSAFAKPTLVGIESLLALKQACRTMHLNDRDIECIFVRSAREALGLPVPRETPDVQQQYRAAKVIIPGGTQLLSKRPEMFAPEVWPAYYEEARGCEVIDTEGRKFIDMSLGGILATVLGYADPDVNAAVMRRVQFGSMATLQTHDEVELAELLLQIHPWARMARFTRTGGEAMAAAVRIARAATGRDEIAICGYHGWHDWYLAANLSANEAAAKGAGAKGEGTNDALRGHLLPGLLPAGVPRALAGTAHTFHYNKLDELDAVLARREGRLAAIVMEPTRAIDPAPGFLEGVRERANRASVKLLFDEISIGWRLCLGGAHRKFGVEPDVAVFAKTTSNGFALGAIIGNADTMQAAQESFISSAYWTEGIGPAAGVAAVKKMMRIDVPSHLRNIGELVRSGWNALAAKHQLPIHAGGRPELASLAIEHPQAPALQTLITARMVERGFLSSAAFNPMLAHEPRHIEAYLAALDEVFAEVAAAISNGDVEKRLKTPVKHAGFGRLTG